MQQEEQVHSKPGWLEPFLKTKFFNNCSAHNLSKNDTKMYCIDCNLAICIHCFSPSGSCDGHKTLRIYRHVYQDGVVVEDLKKLIDCSKIQLYKRNKNRIVALHPLELKRKDQQVAETSSACKICKRNLHNPAVYHYCSIKCKVEAFLMKGKATDPPFLRLKAAAAATDMDTAAADMAETSGTAGFSTSKKKKRKGIPHRAATN